MSIVSDFVTNAATQSFAMIGAEMLTVGSLSISCIVAEIEDSKDFSEGGFEARKRLTATCLSSALPATSLLKKSAVVRGLAMRIESVSSGISFSTIQLEEVQKA